MGRRRGGGGSPRVKGFRPGKEPPQLRKRAARQELGDLNPAQERMVELFAERTPAEARKLMASWRTGSLVAGVLLSVLTVVAWSWSWIAGAGVGLLAAVVLFVHLRLRSQRAALEAMADTVARGPGRR